MPPAQNQSSGPIGAPRFWPGILLVATQWIIRFALPAMAPESVYVAIIGSVVLGVCVLLWWLLFSRVPWPQRLLAAMLLVFPLFTAQRVLHPSVATGMMGLMFPISAIPFLCLALVVWAVASRGWRPAPQAIGLIAAILTVCGGFTLLRTEGIDGDADSDFAWRWTPTREERLLIQSAPLPPTLPHSNSAPGPQEQGTNPTPAAIPTGASPDLHRATAARAPKEYVEMVPEWPGFRGPQRNSVVAGLRIDTDWSAHKPVELWRCPVGPGWSSFAISGDRLYTQEQRGGEELVACYRASSGVPIWAHRDSARFWESNGGAGPRGTPQVDKERVYSLGATGILNALDAQTGKRIWSRNAAVDTGAKLPAWGFSGSPLVADGIVVVATSGTLAAYDASDGQPRWKGPDGGTSYSSPQLLVRDGSKQILLMHAGGVTGVALEDGKILWQVEWKGQRIVQPASVDGGDLLISGGNGDGMRRVALLSGPAAWIPEERWSTNGLKPYFNDFVVHNGHAYGFDGAILACIDLASGKRVWKGGRYGHGQMLLVQDQGILLVISEDGELALVRASPDGFTQLARVPAIEGKTWNHPAIAGDRLFVRNAQEMAAFQLRREPDRSEKENGSSEGRSP
jgi:outer membrane protein assembly factor BamB